LLASSSSSTVQGSSQKRILIQVYPKLWRTSCGGLKGPIDAPQPVNIEKQKITAQGN
jgi:hypothetical protein